MTPSSRIIAAMLLIGILVSSAFLVRGSSSVSNEYLFGGRDLSDAELDSIESAFGIAGLHEYDRIGRRIKIPTAQRSTYIKALVENDALPRNLDNTIEQAIASSSFLEPLELAQQRIQARKLKDLATAIKAIPFVESASVSYDEDKQGFSSKKLQTATVFVMPKLGRPLTDQQKRDIMKMVSTSFAGLKYENISIADLSNGAAMLGAHDPLTAEDQKYYYTKSQQEAQLKSKAENLLSNYGDVRVEVYVDLDTTLREASEVVKFDEKPTTLETSEMKKESETAKPADGGRPGANPNAIATANRSQSLEQYASETAKQKESNVSERKVAGTQTTITDRVGLVIKRASFSVAIPRSYYKKAFQRQWLEQNPDKSDADLASIDKTVQVQGITAIKEQVDKEIQRTLANIIPPEAPGGDRFPLIEVTDYLDEPSAPIEGPGMAEMILAYLLSSWQLIGMFGLAGFALLFLRSVSKSAPTGNTDGPFERGFDLQLEDPATWDMSALDQSELAEIGGNENVTTDENGKVTRKFNLTGGEIKEELTTMVRDNPDAAASLLRSWIGDSV